MLVSWTIPLIYQYQILNQYKKGMDRSNKKKSKILYKCITANTSVIWEHAVHITDRLISPSCYEEFSGKSSWEWASRQKKDKTERVTGLSRRTRKKIDSKVGSNDSPEIPDSEETSDIPGLLTWGTMSLRDGLEYDMCIQSDRRFSGQFTPGRCQAGGRLMGLAGMSTESVHAS